MQYVNNFIQKRYKVSIATTSSNFFLFSLFWGTTRIYFMSSFFLIDINNLPNHIVFTVKLLAADDILFSIAHNAKLLVGELNSDIKANLNGHSSICCLIQIWIMLKKIYFHGKWQNHFTHKTVSTFIICRNLSEWKIEFILPYLLRNFQTKARNKLATQHF